MRKRLLGNFLNELTTRGPRRDQRTEGKTELQRWIPKYLPVPQTR